MKVREDCELLESLCVELDLLVGVGVLLEVYRRGDRYVLLETAPATGNRLLRFSSKKSWSTPPSPESSVLY